MAHTISYEAFKGKDRGEDFTVRTDELTPLQNKMMDLAASTLKRPARLNN